MIFTETNLAGAFLLAQERHEDERGFFARQYCAREFAAHGLPAVFVQVNNSQSVCRHTLRGLHYQVPPAGEAKLMRCIRGCLLDVIVDLRAGSATYLQHYSVALSADNRLMLYVPKGFAHGYLTLDDDTEALYSVDEYYTPGTERGLRWDDPACAIDWPAPPAVLSDKDASWPDFAGVAPAGG